MSGSCTPDSHSSPHHSAYPSVCHRAVTQRSHACPIEDSGYPQPRGSIYAHPVTAPQDPTATDVAVHWWRLAGNSTDPADLDLLAPRERARPNRPPTPLGRRDHGLPAAPHPPSPFGAGLTHPSGRCPASAARPPAGGDAEAGRAPGGDEPARDARTPAGAGRRPGRPAGHPHHLGVHDVTVPGARTATTAAPFGVPTRVALSPHPEVHEQIPRPVPPPHGRPPAISRSHTHP